MARIHADGKKRMLEYVLDSALLSAPSASSALKHDRRRSIPVVVTVEHKRSAESDRFRLFVFFDHGMTDIVDVCEPMKRTVECER